MAEPDAAGPAPASGPEPPAPTGSRSFTLADIQRDIDRATAPLRAAQRQAERSMAPMLAAVRQAERFQRQIDAVVDNGIGRVFREMLGSPPSPHHGGQPAAAEPDATTLPHAGGRLCQTPAPASPGAGTSAEPLDRLDLEAIRAAVKPFLEELVADVKKTLAETVADLKKKRPTKRGKTTEERLRDLFKQDPEFALSRPLEEIGKRIGRRASTIAGEDCHYYHSKLKPLREKAAAAVALAKNDAARLLPSERQAASAHREHLEAIAAIDEALDRDSGSHLARGG